MSKAVRISVVLVSCLLLGLASTALAVPITFIHESNGIGNLDGDTFFEDKDIVITAAGDTDDRTIFGGGFFIDHLTATIEIEDVGTFDFLTATRTFVNTSNNTVGFSRAGIGGADLLNGPTDLSFGAWDMLSSIGPISGAGSFLQWGNSPVNTTGGVLFFDNSGARVTFTAIVDGEAPVPASILLLGLGLVGLGVHRRK